MTSNKCHTQSSKSNIQSNFRILRDCITIAKEKTRRKKVTLGSRFYTATRLWVMFSLSTLYFITFDWSLTTRIKQCARNINVVLGWAGICGEGRNTSSPKKARVGCYKNPDDWVQDLSRQLGQLCKFKGIILCKHYFWNDQKDKKNTRQGKTLCRTIC